MGTEYWRLSMDCIIGNDLELGIFDSQEKAMEVCDAIRPKDGEKMGPKVAFFIHPVRLNEVKYPIEMLKRIAMF